MIIAPHFIEKYISIFIVIFIWLFPSVFGLTSFIYFLKHYINKSINNKYKFILIINFINMLWGWVSLFLFIMLLWGSNIEEYLVWIFLIIQFLFIYITPFVNAILLYIQRKNEENL
jgi:hypothetical protein